MSTGQILRDKTGKPLLEVYAMPHWATAHTGPQLVQFNRDPLQDRIRPAVERMQKAEDAITAWQKAGMRPWVMWEPRIEIWDSERLVLAHPFGCLPEVIYLIHRKYPPDTEGLRYPHNRKPPYATGGAA